MTRQEWNSEILFTGTSSSFKGINKMAFRVSNCAKVRSCHFRWIKLQQQRCRQLCFITGLYFMYYAAAYIQGYILCTELQHTFYVLCFIIHSMSYVSPHVLCPIFHQTFYALCFITFQVLVLPHIPRLIIYHTFYVLYFIIHSMYYNLS